MTKMSAREYYYKFMAPDEMGKNYSEYNNIIRRSIEDTEYSALIEVILNHIPQKSNDILIEHIIDELISYSDGAIKERLEKVFVFKRRDFIANAGALNSRSEHDGDLIEFNVGLSDAAFQYCTLFDAMILTKEQAYNNYAAPSHLLKMSQKLADAQARWSENFGHIQLSPEDVLLPNENLKQTDDRPANIARCTDVFILAHEFAHHMLNHTSKGDDYRLLLNRCFSRPQPDGWESFSSEWQQELAADTAAIGLITGTVGTASNEVTAALGSLLTMTVLGQLVEDVDAGTDTHPPVMLRYKNCITTLLAVSSYNYYPIVRDMANFQRILFRIQNRGLGKHNMRITKGGQKENAK